MASTIILTPGRPFDMLCAIAWIRPVLDIMMSGVAETVDYQLRQMFRAVGAPERYLRIEVELRAGTSTATVGDIASRIGRLNAVDEVEAYGGWFSRLDQLVDTGRGLAGAIAIWIVVFAVLVVRRQDGHYIDDLGSLNGTYVNRRRIESHLLADGDEIQIGKYKLSYLER